MIAFKAIAYVLGVMLAVSVFLDQTMTLPLPLWSRVVLVAIISILWPVTLPAYAIWTIFLYIKIS